MDKAAQKKWNRIYTEAQIAGATPSKVLQDHTYLLPKQGKALDLACGTGGAAMFLAGQGLEVDACDISDAVIHKLNDFARLRGLVIHGFVQDVTITPLETAAYDVIHVAHYLERDIVPGLKTALKPGGLIFYQTFVKEVTQNYTGPSNPAFRLGRNELLKLFQDFHIVFYQEDGLIGDLQQGFRNEAMLVAQRPA